MSRIRINESNTIVKVTTNRNVVKVVDRNVTHIVKMSGVISNVGPAGPPGESIQSVGISYGQLIITKNTGETLDAGYVIGPTGATGPAGESSVGVSGPDFSRIGIKALEFIQGKNVTIGITGSGDTASIEISVININAGDYT